MLHAISRASALRLTDRRAFDDALAKNGFDPRVCLRDYQLAFVTRLAIEHFDKPRLSRRKLQPHDPIEMCRLMTKYQSPAEYPVTDADDAHRFMIRVAYQQFPDFVGERDTIARTYLLYKDCAQEVSSKLGFNINERLYRATKLSLEQVWDLTLALFGLTLARKGGIVQGPLTIGDLGSSMSQSHLDRYLKMVGATLGEYQSLAHHPTRAFDPYETFNPNPLFDKPVLQLDGNRWVVPIPRYLLERGTSAIFYDLIGHYGRDFAGYFGYVFENYVDRILSVLPHDCEVLPEFTYQVGSQTFHSCSRIVIGHGDAALIECKTRRLRIDTKCTADEKRLRRDLTDWNVLEDKGSVVAGIRQLHRFNSHVRQRVPGLRDLCDRVSGRIFPIIVVLDPYYFSNAPYVGRIIDEELQKGTDPVRGFEYQIVDITGMEMICALAKKDSFFDPVERKFSEPAHQGSDLKPFIDQLCKEGEVALEHPVLRAALDRFWSELGLRYGRSL